MQQYELKLCDCLVAVHENDFDSLPNDEDITHIFSKSFYKKMNKLIKAENHGHFTIVSTIARRVAIIALVVIISMSSILSVKALREPIFNFIYRIYNTHTNISSNNKEQLSIEKVYSIKSYPEGYHEKSFESSTLYTSSIYENEDGKIIYFSQSVAKNSMNINSENSLPVEKSINGINVLVVENDNGNTLAIWEENNYIFYLTYPIELGEDFLSSVVNNLKEK